MHLLAANLYHAEALIDWLGPAEIECNLEPSFQIWWQFKMQNEDTKDLGEDQVFPQGIIFHAAPKDVVAEILKNGLKPSAGGRTFLNRTYSPRVYMTTRIEAAWDFTMSVNAHSEDDTEYAVIHIDLSKLPEDVVFFEDSFFSDYGIWTASAVMPQAIVGVSDVDHDWEPDDDYYNGAGADHKVQRKAVAAQGMIKSR